MADDRPLVIRDEPSPRRIPRNSRAAQSVQAFRRGKITPDGNVLGVEGIHPNDALAELHRTEISSRLSQGRIASVLVRAVVEAESRTRVGPAMTNDVLL